MYWCIHAYSATDRLIPKKAQRIDKIERVICNQVNLVYGDGHGKPELCQGRNK